MSPFSIVVCRLLAISVLLAGCAHARPPSVIVPTPPPSTPPTAWEPPRPHTAQPAARARPQRTAPVLRYAMWDTGETVLAEVQQDRSVLVWRGTVDAPPFQGTMLLAPDHFAQVQRAVQAVVADARPLPTPTPTPASAGPIVDGPTQEISIQAPTPMVITLGVGGLAAAHLPPALQALVQELQQLRQAIDREIPPLPPTLLTYTAATPTETLTLAIATNGQVSYRGIRGQVLPPATLQQLTTTIQTLIDARDPTPLATGGSTHDALDVSIWWYGAPRVYAVRARPGARVSPALDMLLHELAIIYDTAQP